MHGLVLRQPSRTVISSGATAIGATPPPTRPPTPLKNMEQLMAEADPVRTGAIRMMGRPTTETTPSAPKSEPAETKPAEPAPKKAEVVVPSAATPIPKKGATTDSLIPPPFPAFKPAEGQGGQTRRIHPPTPPMAPPFSVASPTIRSVQTAATTLPLRPRISTTDAPFILRSGPSASLPKPVEPVTPTPPPIPPAAVAAPAPLASTPTPETSVVAPAASSKTGAVNVVPQPPPPAMAGVTVVRRRAKMAEVARIVLPPRRDESCPINPAPAIAPSAVVPPAFPVTAMTARVSQRIILTSPVARITTPVQVVGTPEEKEESPFIVAREERPTEPAIAAKAPIETKPEVKNITPEPPPVEPKSEPAIPEAKTEVLPPEKPEPIAAKEEKIETPEKAPEPPAPVVETKTGSLFPDAPKVDPQAHQPEPGADLEPRVDPEAHKPLVEPVPVIIPEIAKPEPAPEPKIEAHQPPVEPVPIIVPKIAKPETAPAPIAESKPESKIEPEVQPPAAEVNAPVVTRERKEFHLTNGERVAGFVVSETPEAVYLEHGTLGIVTVPRAQIAKRLVEIILINGDRIVGDIMAETADTLYVRHASLGMLTVPRAQRSTRVVEAILKDGDRILGEVLTETADFTVIRSATLGTITVPHNKIQMLNRKVEQIELKALPAPALPDKA